MSSHAMAASTVAPEFARALRERLRASPSQVWLAREGIGDLPAFFAIRGTDDDDEHSFVLLCVLLHPEDGTGRLAERRIHDSDVLSHVRWRGNAMQQPR